MDYQPFSSATAQTLIQPHSIYIQPYPARKWLNIITTTNPTIQHHAFCVLTLIPMAQGQPVHKVPPKTWKLMKKTRRIQDILHNRRKISADTSIRLGRFFGVSDRFFLDMQNDIEVRELTEKLDGDITTIKPYAAAAM